MTDEIVLEEKIKDAKFFEKSDIGGLDLVDSARWLFDKHFGISN